MAVETAELSRIPLFASLSESDLAELGCWFDTQSASAGVRLAGEGAAGYSFFVIAEGAASVTADGQTLGALGPGDFFGEIAILGNGRRSATVTATEPSRLFVMFGTEFRRLQQAHPLIASQLEAAMRERTRAA